MGIMGPWVDRPTHSFPISFQAVPSQPPCGHHPGCASGVSAARRGSRGQGWVSHTSGPLPGTQQYEQEPSVFVSSASRGCKSNPCSLGAMVQV